MAVSLIFLRPNLIIAPIPWWPRGRKLEPLSAYRRQIVSSADRTLVCRECGVEFTFSAGEQAFFASRGLLHEPSRCSSCRNARKAVCQPDGEYHSYGPSASFGGRIPRQMHPATCSACGQLAEVPFIPRAGKPVYCSECYEEQTKPQCASEPQP